MEIARSDTIPAVMINCIRLTSSDDLAFPIGYWRRWWCYSLLYSSFFSILFIVSRASNAWRPALGKIPAPIRSIRLTIISKSNVKRPPRVATVNFPLVFAWKSPALSSMSIETSIDRCYIAVSICGHALRITSWSRRVHRTRRVIFVWRISIRSKEYECKERSPCVRRMAVIAALDYSLALRFSSLHCLFYLRINSNKYPGQIQNRLEFSNATRTTEVTYSWQIDWEWMKANRLITVLHVYYESNARLKKQKQFLFPACFPFISFSCESFTDSKVTQRWDKGRNLLPIKPVDTRIFSTS